MPVVEAVEQMLPSTFSKGSGAYAPIKQKISETDFDSASVKVTCTDKDDLRKTMIAVRTYLAKNREKNPALEGVVARTNNLEIWVGKQK